ncbi:hypothetical protein CB1_001652006 [Camelus ferus]|nr:hypothetical protein CB1_001652006 [Camelus ferus]
MSVKEQQCRWILESKACTVVAKEHAFLDVIVNLLLSVSLKDRPSVSAFCSRLLNQATKLYNTAAVVPVNHVFFTTSAIIAAEGQKKVMERALTMTSVATASSSA